MTIIATIFVCKIDIKYDQVGRIMFIIGAVTAYFDLFIMPVLPFGMVTTVLLLVFFHRKIIVNIIRGFNLLTTMAMAWCFGYIILWSTKWLFASFILKKMYFLVHSKKFCFNQGGEIWLGNHNRKWNTLSSPYKEIFKKCFHSMCAVF